MLQVVHVLQIVLAFIVAGATGMQSTMPQYNTIWSPIQLIATTVLTVLGLVSQPVGQNLVLKAVHEKLDKLLGAAPAKAA